MRKHLKAFPWATLLDYQTWATKPTPNFWPSCLLRISDAHLFCGFNTSRTYDSSSYGGLALEVAFFSFNSYSTKPRLSNNTFCAGTTLNLGVFSTTTPKLGLVKP